MSSAPTPISSNRRAARPKASPSGGPQCWPNTPQTPCRQRRNDSHTGRPVCSSSSTVSNVSGSRIRVRVSSSRRSGGSSSKTRESSSIVPRRSRRVRLLGDREGDGAVAAAAGLLDRLARQAHAEPRDVEPLGAAAGAGAVAHLELGGGEDRPRVGRDDVAARGDVRAVHVEHGLRGPVQGPGAPQLGVGVGVPLQLRGHAAVQDDAPVRRDQLLEAGVRPRADQRAAGTGGVRHRREYQVRDRQPHGAAAAVDSQAGSDDRLEG